MKNQKDPQFSPEDELNSENNLLKLKLGLEHGMQMGPTTDLSPDVENQWLKSVYAFEQQFKDAKPIAVYDYIGRPPFEKWDTLTPEKLRHELSRIKSLLEENQLDVALLCEYDDATIYRFITEELFAHEIDNMRIPGMVTHFVYEEFHPNHDYDVRRETTDFVNAIFSRLWNEEYHEIALARKVSLSGTEYDRAGISSFVKAFQEAHTSLCLDEFNIDEVIIDNQITRADVRASISVSGKTEAGDHIENKGHGSFHFVREDGYWFISHFHLPGLAKD
jgi:hypothetical protein